MGVHHSFHSVGICWVCAVCLDCEVDWHSHKEARQRKPFPLQSKHSMGRKTVRAKQNKKIRAKHQYHCWEGIEIFFVYWLSIVLVVITFRASGNSLREVVEPGCPPSAFTLLCGQYLQSTKFKAQLWTYVSTSLNSDARRGRWLVEVTETGRQGCSYHIILDAATPFSSLQTQQAWNAFVYRESGFHNACEFWSLLPAMLFSLRGKEHFYNLVPACPQLGLPKNNHILKS